MTASDNARDDTRRAPRLVRPYALTGGRTRASGAPLPLEALVVSTWDGHDKVGTLSAEQAQIITRCKTPSSIVELSAELGLPVGVTRVLVGDLASEGLVQVHGDQQASAVNADVQLLERVLHGINAL